MKSTKLLAVSVSGATPDLDAIFPPPLTGRLLSSGFTAKYADDLLARSPVNSPALLSKVLSDHLRTRIDRLDSLLDLIATRGALDKQTEAVRSAALDQAVAIHNAYPVPEGGGQKKKVRARYRDLKGWRTGAITLGVIEDYVRAFERFASLEVAIEQVERVCDPIVAAIDEIIEEEIDRRRWD